jgi:hypothetical protein
MQLSRDKGELKRLTNIAEICYKVFMGNYDHKKNESPIRPASSPLSKKDRERILEVALGFMYLRAISVTVSYLVSYLQND